MCGICGKLAWEGPEEVSEPVVRAMTATLAHRGPDGEGHHLWSDDGVAVGLGHRRLSIIDLSDAGRQPMANADGTVWVIHNGEVYNFRELRSELEALGYRFRSKTDTEVILHAYEAWGSGCVERLQGMFAFAVWDQGRRRLFLARDRVGIKPLYYAVRGGALLFASEMKALLQDPALDTGLDNGALDSYLAFGYVPAPDTIFRSVKKLPPAHVLSWQDGRVHIERYWQYRAARETAPARDEGEWLEEFEAVLQKAVARQMVSDVPLGAFLSGGIDSSLIVWMMSRASDQPVQSFTVGFDEQGWSEAPYARRAASRFATEHHEYDVSAAAMDILPKLVWHLDEPFGDSSMLPTYYVSKMTRQRVTVALSGDGGDELFAGYSRYQGERLSNIFQRLPRWVQSGVVSTLRAAPLSRTAPARRLGNVLANAGLDFASRYRNKQSLGEAGTRRELYADDFRRSLAAEADPLDDLLASAPKGDFVDRLTALDMEFYLPNDMLVKVDRMSMASSLEVRVPFLDEKVIETASRIPTHLKLRNFTTKYLLRKLASKALPPEISRRGKQGFGVPIHSWFRGALVDAARDLLLDGRTLRRGYFARRALEALLDRHQRGMQDHGHLIFALMSLETWNRVFIDHRGTSP
ncbi:MAG: asparagine synthase (glutamine-hydrolyzing) [Candidatus Krumholzibacteriia bacterium]